jgi:hypothetical protein
MPQGSSKPRWLEINNGVQQLLVYADDVSILGGSVHTVKKNTEVVIFDSKEISLKLTANETKHAFIS